MMNKKCIGCGIELQTIDSNKPGYIKEEKINDSKYCERCFRLIHYNEYKQVELKDINNRIISKIEKNKHLTFFLVDLLNINEETINCFKNISAEKILVISKKDIIPKSIKEDKIIKYLKNTYHIDNKIIFLSPKKGYNTKKIIDIANNYNEKTIYIVGYTNSGKSTLINNLCQKENIKPEITTSSIPNTTLDFLTIEINGLKIIDTPGFVLNNNLFANNEYNLIKRINPKKPLNPLTYQTKDITGFNIENKIYLTPSNKNSLTFYINNDIKIEKVYKNNLTNLTKITLEIPDNSDLIIKSLGFINIKNKCTMTIYCEKDNLFEIRKSLFTKEQ